MENSGSFIAKLCNFRTIRDLQKLFYREQQKTNNDGDRVDYREHDIRSSGLGSLVYQQQTHTHLSAKAALSYWQTNSNPVTVNRTHPIKIKSPIRITMSYR